MKKSLLLIAAVCGLCSCSAGPAVGIIAHRGYWNCEEGGMSHNSIAALKAACEHGFWGTEFDVNLTADNQLLVYHDGAIEGKKICEHNFADFSDFRLPNGEKIPTLDEYLDVAVKYPKTRLVLELKPHDDESQQRIAVDGIISSLERHGLFSPDRVMFISFSLSECRLFAESAPGFTVQYLDTDNDVKTLIENHVNGIDIYYKAFLTEPKWHDDARANGFSINVWTVDDEESLRSCVDAKVDQITTNNPELLRSILAEKGVRELRF